MSEQAQKQDESEKAKRKLIELTKEWRRTADEVIMTVAFGHNVFGPSKIVSNIKFSPFFPLSKFVI